ncbi:MAG: Trk system potassium transport protein TrkA [Verrucomicrobia bacterium]|jgi:trk system potassium uptake protein|nr:Trk system potassium transport protein TrkA [Verrucomicrobiota bacterium]MBT7067453.1 Trk system potassium transport protein TrkA [Verrucomicrobiota bacterium]MBT7700156.1 Trk system potassium transport protein TrkA [Verrucomicrobiota bacterium]
MRILIIGAGNAGRHLAGKLCDMSHEVVVVDRDQERLALLEAQLDILTVRGSGSSPDVLERAELAKANLLIAVTNSDEVNLLACICAHEAGVPNTVARIVNPALMESPLLDYKRLGVDCLVSQNQEAADELFEILKNPGLLESVWLLDGRALIARVQVRPGSPLLNGTLADLSVAHAAADETTPDSGAASSSEPRQVPAEAAPHGAVANLMARVRFITALRGDVSFLPRGDARFEVGDDLYVAVLPGDLSRFLDWMYPGRHAFGKSVIAGGGGLGLNLARRLETASIPAVLLERDAARAGECSDVLHKTLVLNGDASDQEMMVNAGVGPNTAFVAITGDEELNIISCMLAHKLGAPLTVALVSKPEYVPVIRSLGLLSRVVSPHLSMTNAILHYVRGKHIRAATWLHKAPGELLHVVVREGHRWAGKPISGLKMPGECLIATVLRGDTIHVPTGDLTVEEGDQLVIFALPADVGRVQSLFKR